MPINLNNIENSSSVWGMRAGENTNIPSFVYNIQQVRVEKNGTVTAEGNMSLGMRGEHNTTAIIFDLSQLGIDSKDYYQQCVFYNVDDNTKNTIRFKEEVLLVPDIVTNHVGHYKIILMLVHKQNNSRFISKEFSGQVQSNEVFNFNKEDIKNPICFELTPVEESATIIRDEISLIINEDNSLVANETNVNLGEEFDRTVNYLNLTEIFNKITSNNYYLVVKKHNETKIYSFDEKLYWIPTEWTKGTGNEVDDTVYLAIATYGIDSGKEFFYLSNTLELTLEENWLEEEDLIFDYSNNWTILTDKDGQKLYDNIEAMLEASDD